MPLLHSRLPTVLPADGSAACGHNLRDQVAAKWRSLRTGCSILAYAEETREGQRGGQREGGDDEDAGTTTGALVSDLYSTWESAAQIRLLKACVHTLFLSLPYIFLIHDALRQTFLLKGKTLLWRAAGDACHWISSDMIWCIAIH